MAKFVFEKLPDNTKVITVIGKNHFGGTFLKQEIIESPVVFDELKVKIEAVQQLLEALEKAQMQIEYIHEKFRETGSGETVLSRIKAALAAAKGENQ